MTGLETIASLGEFGLIERLFATLPVENGQGIEVGVGDDAAVLSIPRTQQLLTTTDTLSEGVHFNSDCDPYLLGQKALRVNLSDIAAMGGTPHWYLLSVALRPSLPLSWAKEFARGLRSVEESFGVVLIGGDTVASRGCIAITVTLMGLVGQGRAVRRSGARPGDRLLVTGTIGDSTLGLGQIMNRIQVTESDDLVFLNCRHWRPEPRVALGRALQEAAVVHAAIDISDGLIADLRHMCRASGVGANLSLDRVPLSDPAKRLLERQGGDLMELLVTGGEDFELLLAVPPTVVEQAQALAQEAGVRLTDIGEFIADSPEVAVTRGGKPVKLSRTGWTHF